MSRSTSSTQLEPAGNIAEIFSGIQGEGIHIGRRMIFLRLAGCDFGCDYCDQPEAQTIPAHAMIERTAGMRNFQRVKNPLSVAQTLAAIVRLSKREKAFAVSLTGGEPLLQAEFLLPLLKQAKRAGMKIMLETNGLHPEKLRTLRRLVDIVSMDFKLRSATGRRTPLSEHRRFLSLAFGGASEVYCKAVVASKTGAPEVVSAARVIGRVSKKIPLVLQPVSAMRGSPKPPAPDKMLKLQAAAACVLDDVRVIPQTHKMMMQR